MHANAVRRICALALVLAPPACANAELPLVVAQVEVAPAASDRVTTIDAGPAATVAPPAVFHGDDAVQDLCAESCPDRIRCVITAHVNAAEAATATTDILGQPAGDLVRIAGPARTKVECSDETGSGGPCPAGTRERSASMQLQNHVARWRTTCVIFDDEPR